MHWTYAMLFRRAAASALLILGGCHALTRVRKPFLGTQNDAAARAMEYELALNMSAGDSAGVTFLGQYDGSPNCPNNPAQMTYHVRSADCNCVGCGLISVPTVWTARTVPYFPHCVASDVTSPPGVSVAG